MKFRDADLISQTHGPEVVSFFDLRR